MIFKTIDDETTLSGQRIVGIFEARKIAQEQATKQLNTDIQCLKDYENACKSGAVSSEDFTRIMGKASTQAQEYSKNIKDGTGSAQIYADKQKTLQKSIQNTGTASKVAAVGVKALSIAGNMLAGMAISFAISKVIEGIEYLATASERAIEKTKELQQEISQISSDYQSERQTLEGLREEYDALTSKIGENGAEASLSADEYERYRDITSEILGITPKLITGWDEEGRAISNKNGLLQQSIDLLDEEYQKSLRNSTTKSKNEEIATGIIEQKKDFDNSGDTKTVSGTRYDLVWKDLENYINEAVANKKINYTYESTGIVGTDDADAAYAINKFVYGDSLYKATEMNTAYGWLGSLQERITSSQENFEKFANSLSNEDNPIYQWFTDEQIDELIRGADEYFQELARIEGEEQQYFQQYKDQLNLNAQAVGDAYSGLDEQTKAGITQMIDSFDYNDMTKEKFSDMATDLKDFVGKLSTDDTLRSYFNNLFKPMGEDESIEDYETRVKTGIDEITSYCESNYPAIKLSFGDVENDVKALKLKYNTAISKFTGDANDVDLGKFFEDNSINDESEIDYWNKVTDGAKSASEAVEIYNEAKTQNPNGITVSFSKAFNSLDFSEQKDELLELAKAGELTPETLKSVEDYNALLSQTGLEIREAVKEIYKLVDATDRLSDMSSDLSSLGTAYKEFKEDGFASVNAIESLREKFGELKDFNGNNLFEDFATIVGSANTTAEEKQDAFNKLATSYLLQEKALGKLTEANKNYYITQLKSMGIANAESIVTKQLESEKQALLLKEEALALTSEGINTSSTEKIKALLKEAGATQLCREALFKLHVQEEIFNTSELDPRGKIEALIELATAYGVTSKNIENARKSIEGDKASGGHSGLHFTEADVKRIQEDLDANLLTDSEYVFSAKVDFNIDDKSKGTSKSDTYFDWIETKLDNLNDQLDETKDKAEDSLNGWKVRADAFKDAENQLKSLIKTEEQAKARYLEEAKKSGLSQPYINLVQQGAIDIDKLSNDDPLKEQIESYQEWYEKAKQCDEAIAELNIDLKQLYRDKREFRWEIFDYLEDSISRITGEADYLVELLSNEDLFDDKGNMTKYADATIGLHVSNLQYYKQQALDYKEEMKSLEKELANGGGQEVLDKYNERVDAHRDAINAIQKEKQAILDLVENGFQVQLEALQKLIDKKKESLNAEKD